MMGINANALISAETESLGCGLAIYSRENWRMLEMLCFYYGPSMNSMRPTSGKIYEDGTPCSSCQAGFSCDDGLCASSNPLTTTTESGSTESGSTESGSTESGSTEGESTESGSTDSTDTSTLELKAEALRVEALKEKALRVAALKALIPAHW